VDGVHDMMLIELEVQGSAINFLPTLHNEICNIFDNIDVYYARSYHTDLPEKLYKEYEDSVIAKVFQP